MEVKTSRYRWKATASGGPDREVMPSFFINTFWACRTGLEARWHDFFASLSLRRIDGTEGVQADRRMGTLVPTSPGDRGLQMSEAKREILGLTGVVRSVGRCGDSVAWDPLVVETKLEEGGERGRTGATVSSKVTTSSAASSRATWAINVVEVCWAKDDSWAGDGDAASRACWAESAGASKTGIATTGSLASNIMGSKPPMVTGCSLSRGKK